jgi:hypothetical protein
MPRISDMLVKAVVYLYPSMADAENAVVDGATGFFVGVPFEQKINDVLYQHIYLVTNEHVASKGIKAARLNLKDGTSQCGLISDDAWLFHPDGDDLAVASVHINLEVFDQLYVPSSMFLTKEFIAEHDIGLGDEIFMVGRFKYHEGRKRNNPSARFGNIAQMPDEGLSVKRTANYTALQEAFLVEMRSIGGYSGSPVFIYLPPLTHRMTKEARPLSSAFYTKLLGVDFGHLPTQEPIKDDKGNKVNGWHVEGNSAMSGVIPTWKLQELLNLPELEKKRKEKEDLVARNRKPDVVLDVMATPDANDTPLLTREEFEDILRKTTHPIDEHKK